LRHRIPSDAEIPGNRSGGIHSVTTPPDGSTAIYHATCVKLSTPYVTDAVAQKFFYPTFFNGSSGGNSNSGILIKPFGADTSGQYSLNVLDTQQSAWDPEYSPSYHNRNGFTQSAPYVMDVDTWYRVEIQMVANTRGASFGNRDGVYRLWIAEWNGSAWTNALLVAEHTNVRYFYSLSDGFKWTRLKVDTFYNGTAGGSAVPEQYVWFNRDTTHNIGA
jgi:hypothetical protein